MDENGEMDNTHMNSDDWNVLLEVVNSQSPQWNNTAINSPETPINNLPQSVSTQAFVQQNAHSMQQNQVARSATSAKPYLRIVEQPAAKALRFRYECEGRSAGSIPGVNSTPENKTYPTIEIVNYDKDVFVVVSCVTKDPPYRPHPHKVVGRDGAGQKYVNGICEVKLSGNSLRAVFSNLGIQCVKKKEVPASLALRKERKINPFNVPFATNDHKSTYDLNVVRLCFQAFIDPTGNRLQALEPQVSDPIYDKKGVFELKICRLCSSSGSAKGGDNLFLFCEKVDKNDIKIKFSECNNEGEIKWSKYAKFEQSDIHKQTGIAFRTPPYERTDILDPVKVYVQLERPSDGGLSQPLEFDYTPDSDPSKRKRFRPGDLKEALSHVKSDLQDGGFLTDNSDFHFQASNFASTSNTTYNIDMMKIEPASSPEWVAQQNYNMVQSPVPQPSPSPSTMQYTPLQNAPQNINQLRMTGNYVSQLPSSSGGSFTLLNNDQPTTSRNAMNFFSPASNIQLQTMNNVPMDISSGNGLGNNVTVTPITNNMVAPQSANAMYQFPVQSVPTNYYIQQPSPCSTVRSPIPQLSPSPVGMQCTILSSNSQNVYPISPSNFATSNSNLTPINHQQSSSPNNIGTNSNGFSALPANTFNYIAQHSPSSMVGSTNSQLSPLHYTTLTTSAQNINQLSPPGATPNFAASNGLTSVNNHQSASTGVANSYSPNIALQINPTNGSVNAATENGMNEMIAGLDLSGNGATLSDLIRKLPEEDLVDIQKLQNSNKK